MSRKNLGRALITGASSGIGAVYADRLARRGYDVVLVARRGDKLAALAERLRAETGREAEVLVADLTQQEDVRRVADRLARDADITVLVNNAGIASTHALVEADVERMATMIDLNVSALTRLTYAVVPRFVREGHGTLINIASIVAIAPELLNGVYGASKAFVLALTQSVHKEVHGTGVRVQAVLPGATATDLWESAGTSLSVLPKEIVMSTEHMVDAALSGLDQGEVVTIPALPDVNDWHALERARDAMRPNLSRATPAARY